MFALILGTSLQGIALLGETSRHTAITERALSDYIGISPKDLEANYLGNFRDTDLAV